MEKGTSGTPGAAIVVPFTNRGPGAPCGPRPPSFFHWRDFKDWVVGMVGKFIVDLTTKADKVSGGTTGNLASIGANGNLADSGIRSFTFDTTPTAGSSNPVTSDGIKQAIEDAKPDDYEQVKAQVSQNAEDIDAVEGKIPSQASAQNQLADKEFVNSSVATSTATFRGTSDAATQAEFETWLDGLTADENDYVFWRTIDAAGNSVFKRYKYNGAEWGWEFDLNNSSFTAEQWAAISSGITSGAVAKLGDLPTSEALAQSFAACVQVNHTGNVSITGLVSTGLSLQNNGIFSHAEGINNIVSGFGAHVEGTTSTASGEFAHAEGEGNIAQNTAEHAQGRFNASHKASNTLGDGGNTLSSIGMGNDFQQRKNAVETMQDGKTFIYGLGGYDGTNPTSAADLASVVNAKADKATTYTKDEVDAAVAATPSDYDSVKARLAAAEGKIPEQASAQNQLADKAFVNSSIATNTAFYISDGGRPFQSLADLETYEGVLTNNDYAFVVGQDSVGNTTYTRYKWSEATETWAEEYVLNNSSFTAAQWEAISSGITSALVAKLGALPTADELAASLLAKYEKPSGGIPKADLAAGVQASLDKADSALQSAPVTSVNNKTGAVALTASDVGAVPTTGGEIAGTLQTRAILISDGKKFGVAISSSGKLTISDWGGGDVSIPNGTGTLALLSDTIRFSTEVSYAVGDVVFHGGAFYRCTTAHTAGAWNASHFSEVIGGLSTGTPTAPTPATGDDSTKVATTAFVQAAISNAVAAAVAAINYDYFMRVNPSTGAVYYTTPDESENNSNEQEAE